MTSTINHNAWRVELWREVRWEDDSDTVLAATYDFVTRADAEAFADGLPGAQIIQPAHFEEDDDDQ